MISPQRSRALLPATSVICASALALSACGGAADPATSSQASSSAHTTAAAAGSNEKEVAKITPRVVLAHDGGLTTLDAASGKVVAETSHPGFLRLNNAGDGRHVMVSDSDTFRVFDAGIAAQKHGDHHHFIEATPGLTDVTYPAAHAGHVVPHHGRTTLFADGTGAIQTLDSDKVADPHAHVTTAKTAAAHHGVAFELADGTLATTQGTADKRTTVQVRRGERVLTQTTDCPGVHGEATAKATPKGDVAVFGCENGPVVLRDGAFHKVKVTDAYARTGNLAGSPASPIVLGDYKVDKAAEPERTTRISLIDTAKNTLDLVDLGSAYWFRSLARGPKGEALVLTADGNVNVIDPATRKVTAKIAAITPWQEKKDWQEAGPAIKVSGDRAYVTDAAAKKLVTIDLTTRKVDKQIDLPHVPVELAVVDGHPEAPAPTTGHRH